MENTNKNSLEIRSATPGDTILVYSLIRELAEYENLLDAVIASPADLQEGLFGEHPRAEALLAYWDNEPVGFALYFMTFSTFVGRPGLYLEDLYVRSAFRGKGIGKALLVYLAKMAVERRCGRFEWAVLNWNDPAIQFYQRLGAKPMNEWTVYRLDGESLSRLASGGEE